MRPSSKLCFRSVANAAHAASSSARAREERGRARGGAARAMRRGRVCQARRGGGEAARQRRGARAVPAEGAHARHMRRRTTSGLCQLTLHPRPISRLSSASLPSSAACHKCLSLPFSAAAFSAAAFSAAAFSAAALELPEPICSLRWWRRVLWRRERVGRLSLTRNRRNRQAPKAPKVRSMTSSTKALRGTGRALELATRASAHEHAKRSQSRTSRGSGARVGLLARCRLISLRGEAMDGSRPASKTRSFSRENETKLDYETYQFAESLHRAHFTIFQTVGFRLRATQPSHAPSACAAAPRVEDHASAG